MQENKSNAAYQNLDLWAKNMKEKYTSIIAGFGEDEGIAGSGRAWVRWRRGLWDVARTTTSWV
jgi:hypothetical protein